MLMKRLTIIGTKEFAAQIVYYASLTKDHCFVGFFDDIAPVGSVVNGYPVLGRVDDAERLYKEGVFDCIFIGIGYTRFDLRQYYYESLKGMVPFANLIMPDTYVHPKAKLGEGNFIGVGTTIDFGTIIHDNVFIHGHTYIAHENELHSHSYIAGRCNTAGCCTIGQRVFIGICACVADHISICDDAWVGLGCIVAKNIKEPGKYMTPAAKLYKIE